MAACCSWKTIPISSSSARALLHRPSSSPSASHFVSIPTMSGGLHSARPAASSHFSVQRLTNFRLYFFYLFPFFVFALFRLEGMLELYESVMQCRLLRLQIVAFLNFNCHNFLFFPYFFTSFLDLIPVIFSFYSPKEVILFFFLSKI